jgi:hypothetical protein
MLEAVVNLFCRGKAEVKVEVEVEDIPTREAFVDFAYFHVIDLRIFSWPKLKPKISFNITSCATQGIESVDSQSIHWNDLESGAGPQAPKTNSKIPNNPNITSKTDQMPPCYQREIRAQHPVAPPRNPRHRRLSKTTTLEPSKKRKQTSDDDGDVSDESPVERGPVKRAQQANRSSDEEAYESGCGPSAEEVRRVDRCGGY